MRCNMLLEMEVRQYYARLNKGGVVEAGAETLLAYILSLISS